MNVTVTFVRKFRKKNLHISNLKAWSKVATVPSGYYTWKIYQKLMVIVPYVLTTLFTVDLTTYDVKSTENAVNGHQLHYSYMETLDKVLSN